MTSNPTTPISIRRNNFNSHCDSNNDVTTGSVSRIPIPSPGAFRRSISLRMRGSKSCLLNSPLVKSSTILTPTLFNDNKTLNKSPMAVSLPSSSSPTLTTTSKISPISSKACDFSSNTFRPSTTTTTNNSNDKNNLKDVVDNSNQMTTDTSFQINNNREEGITINKLEITATNKTLDSQNDENQKQQQQNYDDEKSSLIKNMEKNLNLNSTQNNITATTSPSLCPSTVINKKTTSVSNKRDPNGMVSENYFFVKKKSLL